MFFGSSCDAAAQAKVLGQDQGDQGLRHTLCPASDSITEHVCVRPPTLPRSTAVSGLRLYHGARLCPASDSITEHGCVRPPTLSQSTASNHLSRPMKDEPGGARRPLGPPDQLPQVSASMVLRPLFLPCRDRLVVAMR